MTDPHANGAEDYAHFLDTLGWDIVERLRRPHCVDISVQRVMDEAADCIERLRATLALSSNQRGAD
ncbi:hypothetical protein ACVIYH_009059 [Bradyrhizobium diazoefficiens]